MLAYALPGDATNEYIKIWESTTVENCKRFYRAIVEVFTEHYLRLEVEKFYVYIRGGKIFQQQGQVSM